MLLAVLVATSAALGCSAVRDFIMPPPDGGAASARSRPAEALAHLMIHDAQLLDGRQTSVAVRAGRVVAVGPRRRMASRIGPGTVILDAAGSFVTPGLNDGHVHLEGLALLGDAADLSGATTVAQVIAALESRAAMVTAGGWLWAFGLRPEVAKLLSAADLQRLLPGVPVWLTGGDGHSATLSASLVARLPPELRTTDGRLAEGAARAAWFKLPPPAGERLKAFVVQALNRLASRGVTTVHVMGARPELRQTLEELEFKGRLRVRCLLYLAWPSAGARQWLRQAGMKRRRRRSRPLMGNSKTVVSGSRLVQLVGVKVWIDGTLGARTAALSGPYGDVPGASPQPAMTQEALSSAIAAADRAGVQLAVHAIGDGAIDRLLAAVRTTKRPAGAQPIRIEHAQVVRPDQITKLKGFVCSIQPTHRLADATWSAGRLGPARLSWGYRAATLAKQCALIAGSDAPVSPIAPWASMAAMMTHHRVSERLSALDALRSHMRDPLTGKVRKVAPGQPADLVIWRTKPLPGGKTQPAVKQIVLSGALM